MFLCEILFCLAVITLVFLNLAAELQYLVFCFFVIHSPVQPTLYENLAGNQEPAHNALVKVYTYTVYVTWFFQRETCGIILISA